MEVEGCKDLMTVTRRPTQGNYNRQDMSMDNSHSFDDANRYFRTNVSCPVCHLRITECKGICFFSVAKVLGTAATVVFVTLVQN